MALWFDTQTIALQHLDFDDFNTKLIIYQGRTTSRGSGIQVYNHRMYLLAYAIDPSYSKCDVIELSSYIPDPQVESLAVIYISLATGKCLQLGLRILKNEEARQLMNVSLACLPHNLIKA